VRILKTLPQGSGERRLRYHVLVRSLAVPFISHFVSGFHFSVLVVHVVPRFEINALRTDSITYTPS